MRVPQKKADKGSLKWMQQLTTGAAKPIETAIRHAMELPKSVSFRWLSPLAEDEWAEYRDGDWLDQIGQGHLKDQLRAFWPERGPQWDGLATTSDGKIVLIEAKAHPSEMVSNCAAGALSRERIAEALEAAKIHYGAAPASNWLTGHYQYANRLAHLQFLREHAVDAYLIFVYFLNDRDMRGPNDIAGWVRVIDDCHDHLGLDRERVSKGVFEVYIDVSRADPRSASS